MTTNRLGPRLPSRVWLATVVTAALVCLILGAGSHSGRANGLPLNLRVTSLADAESGSGDEGDLRYCLNRASNGLGATITITVPGTIVLTRGQLTIRGAVTLVGLGAKKTVISGNGASRVFLVEPPGPVTISDLTIANGNSGSGAGIFNTRSVVVVRNCALTNNAATGEFGLGGAIFSWGFGGSKLTVINSTISGNQAGLSGGGVYNSADGGTAIVELLNSTISGNTAVKNGGGIYNQGVNGPAPMTILNCTFNNNSAPELGGGSIYNDCPAGNGVFTIGNTLLGGRSLRGNYRGLLDSQVNIKGPNLSDDTNAFSTFRDLYLSPLANNGGQTLTHALFPNSPAIDAGDAISIPIDPATNLAVQTDQRGSGNARTVVGPRGLNRVDIGAFEFQGDGHEILGGDDLIFTVGTDWRVIDVLANDPSEGSRIVGITSPPLFGSAFVDYGNGTPTPAVIRYTQLDPASLANDHFIYQYKGAAGVGLANVTIINFLNYSGNFDGLIDDSAGKTARAGYLRFAVTRAGGYSAVLTLGGKRYFPKNERGTGVMAHSFGGHFDPKGVGHHVILRPPLPPLEVDLRLNPIRYRITGTISSTDADGAPFSSEFSLSHQVADSTFAGTFTMLLDPAVIPAKVGTLGSGFAIGRITPQGEARITGLLPDGTRFTSGTYLHKENVALHAVLPGSPPGVLSGLLERGRGLISNAGGPIRWSKSPSRGVAPYAAGLDVTLTSKMFRYRIPAMQSNALQSTLPPYTADLRLGATPMRKVTIDSQSKVALVSGNPSTLTMHFDELTGLLFGEVGGLGARKIPVRGIALQGDERAGGFYFDPITGKSQPLSIITTSLAN